MMIMNNEIRTLAFERAATNKIRKAALASGMKSLLQDGKLKVLNGITTAEELLRVVTEVREMRTLCPGCGGAVAMDFMACPQCGHRLNASCNKCGRALQSGWQFCPSCASSAAPKSSKKQLRERQRQLELPPSNIATFKNQNR